jgi:hypothetical protein
MVDPYDGSTPEPVSKWIVDPTAEALLHFVNADPNRTPSFTVFPNPDVFFSQGTGNSEQCAAGPPEVGCNQLNDGFAWNHGYFAPEVNNTWLGLVGPGEANLGLNGLDAAAGPNSAGPSQGGQGQNVQGSGGVWADHTDIRPTLLSLLGLKDDYVGDGRVLTEVLTNAPATINIAGFRGLATCYKQLTSSVGRFGTDVILADTAALKTGSSTDDSQYQSFSSQLQQLGSARDALAGKIKQDLFNAEFTGESLGSTASQDLSACQSLLGQADQLNATSQS